MQLATSSTQGNELLDSFSLIGNSPLFRQVLTLADAVATNDCVVLLEGESGTGKELLARRLHLNSARANGPFIPVNCPAVSESLFESQFYGHIKGAFTGASTDTMGIVRAAEGGTLLLDEIGELPLHLQPKLLRLLQEREVTPVGATKPIPVNARFIAATNRSISKCVAEGTFRSDLYHRLNIVRIVIPALRDRREDINVLLDYYLHFYAVRYNMPQREVSSSVRAALLEYNWPGNVRELCAYVERLYAANLPALSPTQSTWDDGYRSSSAASAIAPVDRMPAPAEPHAECFDLAQSEARTIRKALEAAKFNQSAAAKLLNIHRTTLIRKMKMLGIN